MSLKTFVWKFKDLNKLDSKRTFLKIYFLNNDPAYTVLCTVHTHMSVLPGPLTLRSLCANFCLLLNEWQPHIPQGGRKHLNWPD